MPSQAMQYFIDAFRDRQKASAVEVWEVKRFALLWISDKVDDPG